MYRRCLFCTADLGSNQALEDFPVGRRLAFDPERGRLWANCRVCERWNLSPLEERWEALEECERLFRNSRLRASSDQVGLARLSEGLELVRIGRPPRPEFAAWRYGDQFGRRRRRFLVTTAVGVGVAGGVVMGSAGLIGVAAGAQLLQLVGGANALLQSVRPKLRVSDGAGGLLEIRPQDLRRAHLRMGPPPGMAGGDATPDGPLPDWHLEVGHKGGTNHLSGQAGTRALARILPVVNPAGGSRKAVRGATRELEEVGDPDRYIAEAELRARSQGMGYMSLRGMPRPWERAPRAPAR